MALTSNINEPVLKTPIVDQKADDDVPFTFTVPADTFTDADPGDELSYRALLDDGSPLPEWLSFDPTTRTFSGTPRESDIGELTIRLIVRDQSGKGASTTFTLTVEAPNTAPVATADAVTVAEDATSANLWEQLIGNDTDLDLDSLTITAVGSDGTLGHLEVDLLDRRVRYVADADAFDTLGAGQQATDAFTYTISDGQGGTSTATVSVTVTGVDDSNPITGGNKKEQLTGTAGDDIVRAGNGKDSVSGGAGGDRLFGESGNDALSGGDGADMLDGGVGNDRLAGDGSRDELLGGAGKDNLDGGDGNDRLSGDAGNDVLTGGAGADVVNGGAGKDSLSGGGGNDLFVFGAGSSKDKVLDFRVGEDQLAFDGGVTVVEATTKKGNVVLELSNGGSVTMVGVSDFDAETMVTTLDAFSRAEQPDWTAPLV